MTRHLLAVAAAMLATQAPAADPQGDGALPGFDRAPFVSPRVVQDLVPWLSDQGEQVVAVDLVGSVGANRYSGSFEVVPTAGGNPQVVFTERADAGARAPFFRYQLVGNTASGIHVLRISYGTGGTGVFESLLLLSTERDRALSYDKDRRVLPLDRDRIVLRRLGDVALGDRYAGEVSLRGDDILITRDQRESPLVVWSQDGTVRIEAAPGAAPAPHERRALRGSRDGARLSIAGGVFFPTQPSQLMKLWGPGPGIALGAEYGVAAIAALWGRLDYARLTLDRGEAKGSFYTYGPPTGVAGGDVTIWGFEVGARLRAPSGKLRPYFDFGVGAETIATDDIRVSFLMFPTNEPTTYTIKSSTVTKPAWSAGIGVLYAAAPSVGVFADAHLEVILTEEERTHYVPVRIGVTFP